MLVNITIEATENKKSLTTVTVVGDTQVVRGICRHLGDALESGISTATYQVRQDEEEKESC